MGTFIETGTYLGDTTEWAARHFPEVISIEASPTLFDAAQDRLSGAVNVRLVHGHSQTRIAETVSDLPGPSLFWLDGHWSGPGTAGEEAECPVIEEIRAIDAGTYNHVIFVDDARLFLNKDHLPAPHKPSHWPTVGQVIDAMRARFTDAHVLIHDDVIMRVPRSAASDLERILQPNPNRELNMTATADERMAYSVRQMMMSGRKMDLPVSDAEASALRRAMALRYSEWTGRNLDEDLQLDKSTSK